MTARAFDFRLGERKCFAQGHPNKRPTITLWVQAGAVFGTSLDVSMTVTPAEARAMAVALEAAALHAETVIPDTGLGESAVETPTPPSPMARDAEKLAKVGGET